MPRIPSRRTLTLSLALLLALASAQSALPDAAAEALRRGETAMEEALQTYRRHYPDRPLWQRAFREGRAARDLAPGHPEPLRFLAEAYSRANWHGPAWQAWEAYLELGEDLDAEATPLFVEVGRQLGYTYYEQGDTERAAEVYRRVLDVVPFDLETHTWLGRILLEQGQPEQAIPYWKTVVERNPADRRARYFLELARDQAAHGPEAVTEFRAGVRLYEEGDLVRARERFARATSLNPAYAEAWAWLGRVEFERGDYDDARSFYGRALEHAPDDATYRYFHDEAGRRAAAEGAPVEGAPEEGGAADGPAGDGG